MSAQEYKGATIKEMIHILKIIIDEPPSELLEVTKAFNNHMW